MTLLKLLAKRLIALSILAMTTHMATAQSPSGNHLPSNDAPSTGAPSQDAQPATVHIIHGYSASPSDHWFPWLMRELEADGHSVTVHPMPDSDAPDMDAWRRALEHRIPAAGPRTFFVAHSLGCISLLHHLSALPDGTAIGGVVLVSGFVQPIASLPELDAFTAPDVAFASIQRMTPHRVVIASENDPIVPFGHTAHLSRRLDADLVTATNGGHFLASDGFTEHPAVLGALERMLAGSTEHLDP